MPTYGCNFKTVCNDLVEFSDTTETLAFNKNNALLGYQKSTDTNFIFCADGSAIDYKKEGLVPNDKGDYYVRIEALLPNMIIEIPDVGKVKILTAQLGKLFTNRSPGQGINGIQLTNKFLNENERDMNVWILTIDKNLFDDNESCAQLYDWFGTTGSTVDLNGEKVKIQMNKEIFDLMVKDSELKSAQLVDMYYNIESVVDKWTETNLNHNESNLAAVTAEQHSDSQGWTDMIVSMLNDFTRDQQFKDTAATQFSAGGYSIYGNPLEVFINEQGYELNQVYAKSMIGLVQVDQILDVFLGKGRMNGVNDIIKKENTNKIFATGKEYTHMQGAWDKAFGTIWGNLPDAKTMTNGISKLGANGDVGFYGYMYEVNNTKRHAGIAKELFDAFVKGRTAINNNDYPTRDICICIIRRLVSRVILQKTLDYLDKSISTVTQVGVINNPSPNRIHALSEAMGFLYSCTFTHRGYYYLTLYDNEYNPYINTQLLLDAKVLKKSEGLALKYYLDKSTWDLLGKDGIDTLKTLRLVVANALLENDPPLFLDTATNKWVLTPEKDVKYTFFTADSLNNAGKLSTFSITLPTYPPADTFYSSPDYIHTISAFAVPTSLVTKAHGKDIHPNGFDMLSNGFADDKLEKRGQNGLPPFPVDKHWLTDYTRAICPGSDDVGAPSNTCICEIHNVTSSNFNDGGIPKWPKFCVGPLTFPP